MSTDTTPFRSDCEHALQKLPVIDMTLQFTCTKCGGIRDITADGIQDFGSYEALIAKMLAELGGTIVNERTEPRRWEYPVGGALPPLIDELTTTRALSTAGIGYVEYIDAWVDKGIADGTLTIAKGARYREAIARRCAELGEVPHRQEHIARLDLKAGDVLAVIAPSNSVALMRQMQEHTKLFLERAGVDGVEVLVFPGGTELRVMEGAATQVSGKVRQFVAEKLAAGVMTQEQFREMLQREIRLQGYR